MRFSRRVAGDARPNAISRRVAELTTAGIAIVDLTETNPTAAGIAYPAGLLGPLGTDAAIRYEPHPFGLQCARDAVAADQTRRGARVDPSRVVLTASTSEAYSWLFKLLCDPGDAVLVPRPSYPLFEHLTRLEAIESTYYDLDYHHRWTIDFASIERAPERTRAVVVVSPNNPTGSFLSPEEFVRLASLCEARDWALIADEVFVDYPLTPAAMATDVAATDPPCLTFSLGGLSKSLGLPQVKLGWIIAGGPGRLRDEALGRLELIADSFLSVGTPVQLAAASLLASGGARDAIAARISANHETLRRLVSGFPSCDLLRVEGGWSAVLRVPATASEEEIVLRLLDRHHILVHPGYFFDFPREAYIVISLLPPLSAFDAAIARTLETMSS